MAPYALIDDDGLVCAAERGKAFVCFQELRDIAFPDDAVCRRDHLDFQVHLLDLPQLCTDLCAIGHDDVGIIFFCFVQAEAEVMGFIEQLEADDVLTESVIGKDDLCFRVISEHVVRPVDQRHLDECELMLAGAQRIFGLDPIIFHFFEILLHHVVRAGVGCVDLGLRIGAHDVEETAGVIRFRMLHDDVVDGAIADHAADPLQHLFGEFFFDRIKQRHFIVYHQIGVVCGAFLYRIKASVKVTVVEITDADPVNIFFDLNAFFHLFHLAKHFILSVPKCPLILYLRSGLPA